MLKTSIVPHERLRAIERYSRDNDDDDGGFFACEDHWEEVDALRHALR